MRSCSEVPGGVLEAVDMDIRKDLDRFYKDSEKGSFGVTSKF